MMNASLTGVRDGMEVRDVNDQHLGTVRFVKMGDENPLEPGIDTVTVSGAEYGREGSSIVEEVVETLVPDESDDLPETVRNRLLREGYIRVDTGVFRSDRFVTPTQIAQIGEEIVVLNITKETFMNPIE